MYNEIDPKLHAAEGATAGQGSAPEAPNYDLRTKVLLRTWYASAIILGTVIRTVQDGAGKFVDNVSGTEMHP